MPDKHRTVRAPRGTERSCKGWAQEGALRMLMNNLDPEVAERPQDLVVYGGTGRAARSWEAFDAIVASLRTLEDDETLLVQSGKPVGVFRTHEWAPRVLIANSNLVPEWATWDEFRRLEALGLTMYGQMTAGSWIYIGTQGILQGTYECFSAIAERRFDGSLAGTVTLTAGLGGMGGAQPLAVTHERRRGDRGRGRPTPHRAPPRDALPRRGRRRPRRRPAPGRGRPSRAAPTIDRPARQRRRGGPPAARDRTRRSTSSPTRPRPTTRSATSPPACRSTTRPSCGRRIPRATSSGRGRRWPVTARPWSGSSTAASRSSTTATACAAKPSSAGSTGPSTTPASCPPTSGRCSARARARSGGRPSRATRPTSAPPTRPCWRSSPTTSSSPAGSGWRRTGSPSRACRRASAGSAMASATAWACASTSSSPAGRVKAPIVIGRDHLDSGSVASPYRETESMRDGSDAIADWPLLNALLNTSSGASWVSIHHGGGVGIGRSIHAGMVVVADGTDPGRREARAGAHQRSRHGRRPPRRRRLPGGPPDGPYHRDAPAHARRWRRTGPSGRCCQAA